MRPFRGSALEFTVVLLVQTSDGTTIRTPLEGLEVTRPSELRLLGLPLSRKLRKLEIKLDAIDERQFRVSVQGAKVKEEGRVVLTAREFDYSESILYLYDPIFSTNDLLKPTGPGEAQAELALPPAEHLPASLCCVWGRIQHGIRWDLRLELEGRPGGVERIELPLQVAALDPPA